MQKVKIGDMKFQFEKLNEEQYSIGAAAFRVVDKDGYESFWVVAPATIDKFDDGVATPKDGRVVAFCCNKDNALMVASAINFSIIVARIKMDSLKSECKELADKLGVNADKVLEEVKRLKAEGKSDDEVVEIIKQTMDEFLTDEGKASKDASLKERGEW